jgi:hypothetical protein
MLYFEVLRVGTRHAVRSNHESVATIAGATWRFVWIRDLCAGGAVALTASWLESFALQLLAVFVVLIGLVVGGWSLASESWRRS